MTCLEGGKVYERQNDLEMEGGGTEDASVEGTPRRKAGRARGRGWRSVLGQEENGEKGAVEQGDQSTEHGYRVGASLPSSQAPLTSTVQPPHQTLSRPQREGSRRGLSTSSSLEYSSFSVKMSPPFPDL